MKVEPENLELWNRFHACERNEMIITKSGRCLFPVLKFNLIVENENEINQKNSDSVFSYALSMERIDTFKWKYRHDRWYSLPSAITNPTPIEMNWHLYEPETSPATWSYIEQEGLNFSKVKLTNRKGASTLTTNRITHRLTSTSNTPPSNYFSLLSFGNYVPIIYIINWQKFLPNHPEISGPLSITTIVSHFDISELEKEGSLQRIRVDECSFIAVTHYQNELITHLKKHNNPHAKGFILTDEGMGNVTTPLIPRGRPGRKRRNLIEEFKSPDPNYPSNFNYKITDDVLMASLALEKMSSTGHVPRSESSNRRELDGDGEEGDKKGQGRHIFLSCYNKLK